MKHIQTIFNLLLFPFLFLMRFSLFRSSSMHPEGIYSFPVRAHFQRGRWEEDNDNYSLQKHPKFIGLMQSFLVVFALAASMPNALIADNNGINGTCPGEFIEEITGTTTDASHTENGGIGNGGNDRYRMTFPAAGTLDISTVNRNLGNNQNYYFYVSRNSCGNADADWNIVSAAYGKSHTASVSVNAGDTIYVRLQSIASLPDKGRHDYALTLDFSATVVPGPDTCPGSVIPNLEGASVTATDSFSSVTVPASTTYYYHFTPAVAGTIQTNSSATKYSNSLYIKNGCGANLWSNTANSNNKSSPEIPIAANQQVVIAFERRYTTSLTLDIDFTFTVVPPPEPPTMANIPDQPAEVGTSFTLSIASYVTEPDGDTITYSATGLPPGLTLNATTGIISGTPTFAGTFNVTATATDPDGSANDPFQIIVTNPALNAVDNSYSTTPGIGISGNLLTNDSGTGIELTSNTDPAQGTLAIGPNGDFTYTPSSSASGTDTFTYTITDDFGNTDSATVSISIGTDYQDGVQPFTLINPPNTRNIIGDYVILGNTIECITNKEGTNNESNSYDGVCQDSNAYNDNNYMAKYIDIDGDSGIGAATWNSSSSNFTLPAAYDQQAGHGILWAGIFWQGSINNDLDYKQRRAYVDGSGYDYKYITSNQNIDLETTDGDKLLIRVDNDATYTPLQASTFYYDKAHGEYGGYYAAYTDVTRLLQGKNLAAGDHTITVANITANEGRQSGTGNYAGWSMVVIYKEDDLNGEPRNISIYNGYTVIPNSRQVTISGFKLPKTGTVNAKFSTFAGEGEYIYGTPSGKYDRMVMKRLPSDAGDTMPGAADSNNIFDAILANIDRDSGNDNDVGNANGIDVDAYDVSSIITSYRDIDENINSIYIGLSSNQDYITPSMIAFSTELYQPNICYDYTLDIAGFVIPSIDNVVDTPFGFFGDDPLTARIAITSKEGDFALHDVNVTYRIHDTGQLQYKNGTTAIAPNGVYNYIPAGPGGLNQTYNQTNQGFGMYIGEGASEQPDGPGGIIDAYETRYFKFDNEMMQSSIDTRFDLWIEYTVDYGSGPLALVKNLDASSICQTNTGYYPAWGIFNVSSDEADTSTGQPYNLYTQVSSRNFNARVFSYDTDYTTLIDANATIEVEVFNAGFFGRDTNLSCFNPDSNISAPTFISFNEETSVPLSNLNYDFAIRNAGFRTWHLEAADGRFIEHHCNNRNDQACFSALYSNEYAADTFCNSECSSGGSGCYACLRTYYGRPLCSRDNFSIRPEAFVTQLRDSNQSTNTNDPSQSLAHSRIPSSINLTNSSNLAADYNYRFDVNATNYINDNATPGYIQTFNQFSPDSVSQMFWAPTSGRNVTNCSDIDDKNISVTLFNGNSINTRSDQAYIDRVDQIGEYQFEIHDENWTSADWHPNELRHHTASGFNNSEDCIRNNDAVRFVGNSGQQGCAISSIHTHPSGAAYTALNLRFYPYSFNVGGLTIGARPTNDANATSFIYINTLATALYPNGRDENMSYNIQGTFRAAGYTDTVLSNFVDQCYADDVNMSLFHTYLSDIPANTANLTYDLIDYNTSNTSTITRARGQNTFTGLLTKDVKSPLSILQNPVHFEQSMQGAITMDLGFNFARTNNQELNPRRINFSDFNVSYASSPDINVDLKTDHQIFGNRNIDQNITFLYARAKPGKIFYDDVTEANIDTPVSIVVYCDLGYTECQNRGILALFAQTNEANWWKSWTHDNQNTQDGNIELLSSPATALNKTSASIEEISGTEGEDRTINVSRGAATLPAVIPVNLVVNDPATAAPVNYTDRWLIYNEYNATQPPSPFYRVRFIGGSGWAGQGDTGHVVGGQSNVQKNRRMEW